MADNCTSVKRFPKKPRATYAKIKGLHYFSSLQLEPPINPFSIINKMKNVRYSIENLDGEEGYTAYCAKTKTYKIFIDYCKYKPRITFTAMHEIAHILLSHFEDFDYYNLTEEEEHILDKEADIFAAEILMPKEWVKRCNLHTLNELVNYFKVSREAIETRLKFLNMEHIIEVQPIKTKEENLIEMQRLVQEFRERMPKF